MSERRTQKDLTLGTIFVFDGVDLNHLHSCIMTGDMQALKAAQANLKLQHYQHQLEVGASFFGIDFRDIYSLSISCFQFNATCYYHYS